MRISVRGSSSSSRATCGEPTSISLRSPDPSRSRSQTRFRPRPVDRFGSRRPGQTRDRRPGSPALARRCAAMRAQRPHRRGAGARREQPQDGQLPGAFHVERYAFRLPGRLPGRRRPGLPGRARGLRPARPRRGRCHHTRTAPSGARGVSPGLPGRRTTTISASSRRARRVKSSRARFDPESQGRFALPVTGHVVSTGTKRPFT